MSDSDKKVKLVNLLVDMEQAAERGVMGNARLALIEVRHLAGEAKEILQTLVCVEDVSDCNCKNGGETA